jgi:hypothetical protein
MKEIKNLVLIANIVQEALEKLKHNHYIELLNQLKSLSSCLGEVAVQSRKLAVSLQHTWLYSAQTCCNGIGRSAEDMSYYLSRLKQLTDKPVQEIPKLSTIFEELKQLQQEFGQIDFNKETNTLSVITEPITLQEVYLGPFEIKLELNRLSELCRSSPYYCIALDPHPAATSEEVTHPHVSNDRLCEGEGNSAIRAALEQGRLCDFFTIVRGILNTYSPDSPYVRLDEWDGTACHDCGYVVDSESSYWCTFCDEGYCDQCCSSCHSCYETVCNGCSQLCHACEETTCPNCIGECAECGLLFCNLCLEEDLCPTCKQERKAEDEPDTTEQISTGTDKTANITGSDPTTPGVNLADQRG